jgi:cell division protein FtsB
MRSRGREPSEVTEEECSPRPSGVRRAGRLVGLLGGSAAVFVVLAVAVFPTSTYLDQRAATREVEERLDVLRAQNAAYERRIERLQTTEEIERLAREEYNLVFPGEEAYAVLPAPLPELELPAVWPFGPMFEPDAATIG